MSDFTFPRMQRRVESTAQGEAVPLAAPTAAFSSAPSGLTVQFTDESTDPAPGHIVAWTWDFGDVASPLPIAAFTSTVTGLSVTFHDQSLAVSPRIISAWLWAFGDGGTSTQPTPTHVYAVGGSYNATLTVTDDLGSVSLSVQHAVSTTGGAALLRVGFFGMEDKVGFGPGDDASGLAYTMCWINPHSVADLQGQINLAEDLGIQLMAYVPGGPGNYGGGSGSGFNIGDYRDQLDLMFAHAYFNTAVAEGRMLLYFGDEPQRDIWNIGSVNAYTPTQWNQAARECKLRWPTGLTFGRQLPSVTRGGWGGHAPPAGGYDAIDYGWIQYNNNHAKARQTLLDVLAFEKVSADAINVGIGLSINLVAGGLFNTVDGIAPCWDYLGNGSSSGYVVDREGTGIYASKQKVPCASFNPSGVASVVCGPQWIGKVSQRAAESPIAPFLLYWASPDVSGASDLANYWLRPSWVSMFTTAITQGLARSSFVGWRAPKVYP